MDETKKTVTVVIEFSYDGEYAKAKANLEGRMEGSGTSRVQAKALSYALEDLATKLRAGA